MNAWTTVAGFSVKTHPRLAELSRRNSPPARLLLLTLCTDTTSGHRHLDRAVTQQCWKKNKQQKKNNPAGFSLTLAQTGRSPHSKLLSAESGEARSIKTNIFYEWRHFYEGGREGGWCWLLICSNGTRGHISLPYAVNMRRQRAMNQA